ncbi:MAG: homoserine dehydrogenase, partial [Elusimicrobia bacterium]|nr:homoserine dehydrogenase [Elusimicrobiota bacterium]
MKKKIYLGIIGAGTVGRKLVHLFYQNKSIIESKIGAGIEISAVCDASASALSRLRAIVESIFKKSHGIKFLTSWQKVVEDPKIDIIIELIGGLSPAKEIVISALKKNKNVVTANKAVLAENWDEIFRLARKSQKLVYFEASAGAGIPVIQALNEGLAGNRISSVVGILNGTTNYLLTKMSKDNIEFSGALKLARKSGFAEANPKNDIQGTDTAHKLSILSSIAWSCWIKPSDIYTEGIAGLSVTDIKYAQTEFG